ncbi:hypothetical protein [Staphylococcus caprae]|uniref:hypothetical protein n=1 Tax=Staphylococcus caprae TaxID=29380 RepID=UPI003B21E086
MKNNQSNIPPEIAREITMKILEGETKKFKEHSKNMSDKEKDSLVESILQEHNINNYELNEIMSDYENMFHLSSLARDIMLSIPTNEYIQYSAMYSREADLNDLFLAQEYLNELIEAVKEQHPDYEIDYKEEE